MNILIFNHYAGAPSLGMEYRPYYLAREWVRNGHRVLIVAASFSHVRRKDPKIHSSVTFELIDGIEYCWIKTPPYKGNGIGRVVNMISFIYTLLFKNESFIKKLIPDVVIASSTYPLDIFPARKVANRFSAKLIFELHDLWPLSPIELGDFSKYNPLMLLFQWAENYYCRFSDMVVSILPNTMAYLQKHGLKKEKFVHIPNGIDFNSESLKTLPPREKQMVKVVKSQYPFIIGYAGAHGKANDLLSFVQALEILKDSGIAGVLLGDGNEKHTLVNLVKKKNLKNIFFFDPAPKNQIISFLREFDALYMGLMNRPLFQYGLSPNKLFDYMRAGKPILYAVNSDHNLIKKANCGIICQPQDPHSIAEAALKLRRLSPAERDELGRNGMKYVKKNHDYKRLADQFLNIM